MSSPEWISYNKKSVPFFNHRKMASLGTLPVSAACSQNDAQMDEDIKVRISKASSAYGRLQERVWKPHGIKLNTKIKVYRATVLTTLLYGAEAWIGYRRHVKMLDAFHMRPLRYMYHMGIN